MKLLLNAKPYLHATTIETWGHWLATFDAETRRTGRIVTGVRFDGVDEPSFRAEPIQERRLDGFAAVEVETGSAKALAVRTLKEGATMAASLAEGAALLGIAFRRQDLSEAHTMLAQLIDGIRSVVTISDLCANTLGLRPEMMICQGMPFERWMGEFGRRLAVLLDARDNEDWATMADSLEYELEPAMRDWSSVFEQMAARPPAS